MTTLPPVSVIVPARDAEATLPEALESILAQDYEAGFEVIVADGSERDATRKLVRTRFPDVHLVANLGRSIPSGLNRALEAARHPVIARCDARATLPPDYLTRAVGTLRRTGAVNVGGRVLPAGSTFFERAVALATSTPIGAGDARYRVGGPEGPVDTVFPGVFPRSALEAAGGWDESLPRNEDYELNWRLRENGGVVWFDPDLAVSYRPRGSLGTLARQYFDYGRWKRAVLARHPHSWRLRQLAPPLLLAALAASAALAAAGAAVLAFAPAASATGTALLYAAAICPLSYASLLLAAAAAIGLWRMRPEAGLVPLAAATVHLAWAAGFFAGPPRGETGA
ncbi:MAG: glycosyltransferase family 2 protein [Holophagales bacterium]|nr:glycosyltransferase family 2 protein [Holophagales bacterium]